MTLPMTIRRVVGLLAASTLTAQAAPPPIPPRADPPARVGRLASLSGAVSYHTEDADHWTPAVLNFPVTTGDVFWTDPHARAGIGISGNRLTLGDSTELDMTTLDDHALVATEAQGEVCMRLQQVPQGDTYSVQTPRGIVQIAAAGRYEVVAGDAEHPTTVTVVDGAAQVTGPNLSLQLGPRQTASITGADNFAGTVVAMQTDAFLTSCLADERPAPHPAIAVPAYVELMTGADDLGQYGEWQDTPQYGTVWYPQVETGWIPYRHGRWSYVAPWGWTWIDDAPWGFAPFHYGRWIERDNRWGWVPAEPGNAAAPSYRPVYAPALVTFIGAGAAIGLAAGSFGHGSVGWVPLGPNEPYYPPYRANLDYVRNLNRTSISNVNQIITSNVTVNDNRSSVQNFVNRGGATVVPSAVMSGSQPLGAVGQPLAPAQMAQLRAQARSGVNPVAATVGVTPTVARQFNFAPAAASPAAGPAFQRLAARPSLPPLRGLAPSAPQPVASQTANTTPSATLW